MIILKEEMTGRDFMQCENLNSNMIILKVKCP